MFAKLPLATAITCCTATLLFQFWVAFLRIPGLFIYGCPSGLGIEYRGSLQCSISCYPVQQSIPFDFFCSPSLYTSNGSPSLFLPWWLLLFLFTLFALLVRRHSRLNKIVTGFPVVHA